MIFSVQLQLFMLICIYTIKKPLAAEKLRRVVFSDFDIFGGNQNGTGGRARILIQKIRFFGLNTGEVSVIWNYFFQKLDTAHPSY